MEHFFLFVIFAGTTCALSIPHETKCDETLIGLPCYPAPGETLYIKLMGNATGYIVLFYKALPDKNLNLVIVKNGTVKIRESYRNRIEFFIETGTLKISDLRKDDAGEYGLKVYTPFGMLVRWTTFTLSIKGMNYSISIDIPISAVVIVILIVACCGIWKWTSSRRTGYQTLN